MFGTSIRNRKEAGYVMLGAIVLMAIGALVIASNLDLTSSSASMTRASRERSDEFMTAEQTLGFTASWLRSYSTSFTTIFGRSQFYSKFDRTAPSIGANDSGLFAVPTRVKLQGTNNSVILSKGAGLPSSVYPTTIDTITNLSFNPSAAFANANFGTDSVRVTLVDAVAVDSSLDFGDPDDGNVLPATDFNPIYRIDAMKSTDRGGHVFGYLAGSLVFDHGIGFFGKESIYMNEPCDSYLSNSGAYGGANRRANCTIGSEGQVCITNSSTLYGSIRTKGNFKNDGN
ncbi:MAG: hypothetical protein GYA55_15190 [SAR324 cluster bacterium]|uniref:Type 4 fimbrial biogenesis protein PilX N-terminal domain-containing protein n=1 Tax=SAR324 cluster bacterium TaxID=2024889 RepID=A0A7X9FVF4_9DELT|nr:hypothetical protein [SAR324 cluster bacterium]